MIATDVLIVNNKSVKSKRYAKEYRIVCLGNSQENTCCLNYNTTASYRAFKLQLPLGDRGVNTFPEVGTYFTS